MTNERDAKKSGSNANDSRVSGSTVAFYDSCGASAGSNRNKRVSVREYPSGVHVDNDGLL